MTNNRKSQSGTTVSSEEIARVKGLGFLINKGTNNFNARVITRNGKITANEGRIIANAAEMYGNGEMAMTGRMTVELQAIPYENIEPLMEYLEKNGLETGGTGPKVRPVVSCKGTTCQYGLIDTYGLSLKIHQVFYKGYHDVKLPHKFKIAVGGCPNNCVKPDLNDIGVIGQRIMKYDIEKCRGCNICQIEKGCPVKAAGIRDGKLCIDKDICNGCGRCMGKCPFGVSEDYTIGYKVYIGGRWGKKVSRGIPLGIIFTSEDEVIRVIENAINMFKDKGVSGERFSDTIMRLGFENAEKEILDKE